MIAKIICFTLQGLEGVPVEVETDVSKGLPGYEMVGLPDAAVKESKERVRTAIKNGGMIFPVQKITINFAPADIKKEGASFDLAVAISLLKASEQLVGADVKDIVFLGELALNGDIRPVNGLLPILISAKGQGFTKFIIPADNAKEARFLGGAEIYPAHSLAEVVRHLSGTERIAPLETAEFVVARGERQSSSDLKFVKGQPMARRALEIAVSGGHNLLMIGPPGTGKTLLARCIPTVMPDLTFEEALEITKIHSVAGTLGEEGIVTERPFRTPHHTATTVSMCGGGNRVVHPGEISLAHGGVLFLDELPEYNRSTLEALRQPLEDGKITVSRAGGTVTYPSSFMLCASMNPCPCGNYGSANLTCTCSPAEIRRYRKKVSGPLLDRIDLQVEVDNISYDELTSVTASEPSSAVKERVDRARAVQRERFQGQSVTVNAEMGEREMTAYCALSEEGDKILRSAFEKMHLSARARSRIIKVARTIADLDGSEQILPKHVFEAVSYRIYDKMS
ncbi:MAG: YifB family Mg chelatase-like AAA ATPase [Clostridiales bacterium]|nr:YifB family Mg chelatase-like AAA ATPase [Clostridiales bacterium]